MAGNYLSNPNPQFLDLNGNPVKTGTVDFFEAGPTTTPLDTFTDKDLTPGNENDNPVTLDSAGRSPLPIFLQQLSYNVVVRDSGGSLVWSRDNVSNILQVDLTGLATIATYAAARAIAGATMTADDRFFIETGAANGDGAQGVFYWDAVSVATDDNGTILKLTDTVTGRLLRDFSVLESNFFIPVGDKVADDTVAMQSFANHTSQNKLWNKASVGYAITGQLAFSTDLVLECDNIVVDATGIVGAVTEDAAVLFGSGTTMGALPALTAGPLRGAFTVTFVSAPGVVEGDSICFYDATAGSFNGIDAAWHAGEFAKVATVSGNTVRLFGPLLDSYPIGITMLKINGVKVSITGLLSVEAPAANLIISIKLLRCLDSLPNGLEGFGSDNSSIQLKQCFNTHGLGGNGRHAVLSGNGLDYGVAYANCQNCSMDGYFVGARHGATYGGGDEPGAIPCRNLRTGPFIGTTGEGNVRAANMHGNCEYCSFYGVIDGGVDLQGDHNSIAGTTVHAGPLGECIRFNQMLGWDFDCSNVTFISDGDPSVGSRGVIDLGGNGVAAGVNTVRGGMLNFQGSTIRATATTGILMRFKDRGTVTTDPVVLNLENFVVLEINGAATQVLDTAKVSGNGIDILRLDGFTGANADGFNIDAATKIRGYRFSGFIDHVKNTGVASATVADLFPETLPRAPIVVISHDQAFAGAPKIDVSPDSITTTGFDILIATLDGANFAAGTVRVSWIASLDE